ncbi:putative acyl-CoA dehydrogenase [Hyaloraphidium curvatum]|nr:putative acyl-CoA dehydrogenase [Hyaloraphidium curvatum]
MGKSFTSQEVAQHNHDKDAWIIVDSKVYDVTKFLDEHPGGRKILLRFAGTDASKQFHTYHSDLVMQQFGPKLQIGEVASLIEAVKKEDKQVALPPTAAMLLSNQNEVFGDLAPFCEPAWYQDNYTPYYNESHKKLRAHIRKVLSEHTWLEHVGEWEKAIHNDQGPPRWVFEKVGELGFFRVIVGPPWEAPDLPGIPELPSGIKSKDWDIFHELIVLDELTNSTSVLGSLFGGQAFAIPPLVKYGKDWMKRDLVPALYSGKQTAALAISEPHAGSDVQNIQTNGRLSDDGKFWIVNGEKKWITGGVWADWFTTAVRTGGPGGAGISVMMIPRGKGVKTRHIETQGGVMGGTAYVTFDDVYVPVDNVIGKVNEGFKVLMTNFNHERFLICANTNRMSRVCYQEALHYAHRRKTFGKNLIEHGVIRDKLGNMARQIEATQSWIEHLAYQMYKMPKHIQDARLGGHFALCKLQCTRTFEFCAREASQILGGIAYTKGGQGGRVEALYRAVRGMAIPGGSEEIMADLGVRQSTKVAALMGANLA